jgi:hypothetical protein
MPPRKSAKRSSGARPAGGGQPLTLVYAVGTILTLGFLWVVWPYIADALPVSDQEKAVKRMEKENPEAEVFTLPSPDSKKNP